MRGALYRVPALCPAQAEPACSLSQEHCAANCCDAAMRPQLQAQVQPCVVCLQSAELKLGLLALLDSTVQHAAVMQPWALSCRPRRRNAACW